MAWQLVYHVHSTSCEASLKQSASITSSSGQTPVCPICMTRLVYHIHGTSCEASLKQPAFITFSSGQIPACPANSLPAKTINFVSLYHILSMSYVAWNSLPLIWPETVCCYYHILKWTNTGLSHMAWQLVYHIHGTSCGASLKQHAFITFSSRQTPACPIWQLVYHIHGTFCGASLKQSAFIIFSCGQTPVCSIWPDTAC